MRREAWSARPLHRVVALVYSRDVDLGALADVAMGLLTSARPTAPPEVARDLHPLSAFVVLPLFALANAGVTLEPGGLATPGAGAVLGGVLAGRVLGKLAGCNSTMRGSLAYPLDLGEVPCCWRRR